KTRPPREAFERIPASAGPSRYLITALAMSAGGGQVAVGCVTGEAHVLRANNGKPAVQLEADGRGEVKGVALSPDGSRLAVSAGAQVWLYHLAPSPRGRKCSAAGRTHYLAVAWHPSGGFFATANGDGKVDYWDAETGERRQSFDWGVGKLNCVTF